MRKGCNRRFVPRPQDRHRAKFCSPQCRELARKWRRRLRRRAWRRSQAGREAKHRENQRYRQRHPDYQRRYRQRHLERVRAIERTSKRRLRRGRVQSELVHKGGPRCRRSCSRPGCYDDLPPADRFAVIRRYCSSGCRAVMRRFKNLIAQLTYRSTDIGNYRRKLARKPVASAAGKPP